MPHTGKYVKNAEYDISTQVYAVLCFAYAMNAILCRKYQVRLKHLPKINLKGDGANELQL